ncbi:hypothetical protein [Paracoccus aestuarii]|nr:hypothetical protein [Paracoccus aestuarii]
MARIEREDPMTSTSLPRTSCAMTLSDRRPGPIRRIPAHRR